MIFILHLLRDDPVSFQLRLEQHGEELNLVVGQLRVPEVKYQVDSCLTAIVPCLVIEAIVEDYALILDQLLGLVANTHSGPFSSKQRKMYSELLASWTIVRSDVRPRSQGREEGMEVVSRDNLLENLDSARNFGAILFELDVVQVQVEYVPAATIVPVRAYPIFRDVVLVGVSR